MTRDTWDGDANQPMSYNHWMYTGGNPVNRLDPSGQCWVTLPWSNGPVWIPDGNPLCDGHRPGPGPGLPPDINNYDESHKPQNVSFNGSETPSPEIIYNRGCYDEAIKPAGDERSQFIPSRCETKWPLDVGIDKNGKPYNKDYHSGLCGQISLTAILAAAGAGRSVNEVVDEYIRQNGGSRPDYTGIATLGTFAASGYFSAYMTADVADNHTNVDGWGGIKAMPTHLKNWLSSGSYVIAGIKVNGSTGVLGRGYSYSGRNPNTPFIQPAGAAHWCVITGVSQEWDHAWSRGKDMNPWQWVRIYNPFRNRTEYYWWQDFKDSWTYAESEISGAMLKIDMK